MTSADHTAFNAALDPNCREASRIVEAFAGRLVLQDQLLGRITPSKVRSFAFVAEKGIRWPLLFLVLWPGLF